MNVTERSFLIFFEGGVLFALDLRHIMEVCDSPRIWPVPLAPICCRGAVNIHGYIFAVMVLADLLQRDRCQETGKMIVLHPSVAHLAFLVGQVTRIVRENDVQFSAPSPAPFSSSLIILPEGDAILLEVFELIGVAEKLVSGTPSS